MNSVNILPNLGRFIGLLLLQGLVLKQIALIVGSYFNILLYPLFVFFLPFELATPFLIFLGFAMGLSVDFFYGSIGVHASAGAFAGWIRKSIFKAFEPRGGYSGKDPIASPAYLGWRWFVSATALYFVLFIFWYFSVDYFTFVYLTQITFKTVVAWLLSMVFVLIYGLMFNPKS